MSNQNQKPLYYIEVTDVFAGEANYSWVSRHIIRAKSPRGAINWLARNSGLNWRNDGIKYISLSGATCAFIEDYDKDAHSDFCQIETDQRKEGE